MRGGGVPRRPPRQCDTARAPIVIGPRGAGFYTWAMITELGHFALILAFFVACFQAIVPLVGAHKRWPDETTGEKESSWYSTGK